MKNLFKSVSDCFSDKPAQVQNLKKEAISSCNNGELTALKDRIKRIISSNKKFKDEKVDFESIRQGQILVIDDDNNREYQRVFKDRSMERVDSIENLDYDCHENFLIYVKLRNRHGCLFDEYFILSKVPIGDVDIRWDVDLICIYPEIKGLGRKEIIFNSGKCC